MPYRKERIKNGRGKKATQFKLGNPGRPKGTPNKFTSLKQSFLEAFEQTGGTEGLVKWIKEGRWNREKFYQMVTRLFPQEVAHSGTIKTNTPLVIKVVHVKNGNPENGEGGNGNKKT